MSKQEHRGSERIRLSIPIRVMGTRPGSGGFTENTHTVTVNRAGARVALKNRVNIGETLRIINLENYQEADFHVVGPTNQPANEECEWGVECSEEGRNIWGIELPPPLGGEVGVLLECRACHLQGFMPVTIMEVEVLESTGQIVRECNQCSRQTFWVFGDTTRRPREIPPSEPVAPRAEEAKEARPREKRAHGRVAMKLPILVRNRKNQQETATTESVSKSGVSVSLAMEVTVGDILSVVCPYTSGGQNIEQQAEVRWRSSVPFGGMRVYGLRYIAAKASGLRARS